MAVEKIQATDSLNTGRVKLNAAIDQSNEAITKATSAVATANQAKSTANNVQEQLNQIVIEGDSSVEAAQARVDADGNTYTTLKERLDTKEQSFSAQLAETEQNILDLQTNKADKTETDRLTEDVLTISNTLVKKADIDYLEKRIPLNFNRVKFIGHRGFSYLYAENSMPAFMACGTNRGAFWGCETDIRYTADGHWVCMHDYTLDRTTNGTGIISDLTLAQIRQYQITYDRILDTDYRTIPTLEEYLEIMNMINVVPVIEIKSYGDFTKIINAIRKYGLEEEAVIISFDKNWLREIRELSPKIKIQYLTNILNQNEIDYVKSINGEISISGELVTTQNIELIHSNDIRFGCWTLDEISEIEYAIKLGASYITTNKGAGRFINKFKRITLHNPDGSINVSQAYTSEEAALEWDNTRQAVKISYEYPFWFMLGSLGTAGFISAHTRTTELGYTFATQTENREFLYLKIYKNGNPVNPFNGGLGNDSFWVSILVQSY